ncbi:MAG: hypothetical protein IKH04_05460 [Kiritimatiellae bacterium]|nr:hypothetical protein [Kiritimatiellia bacterium]
MRRNDIKNVLASGSGSIVIGRACDGPEPGGVTRSGFSSQAPFVTMARWRPLEKP